MKYFSRILVSVGVILTAGCSLNRMNLNNGHQMATMVVSDPLYREVAVTLGQTGAITWPKGSLGSMPDSAAGNPSGWMIEALRGMGPFARDSVKAFTKWYWPLSSTVAVTNAGHHSTKINTIREPADEFEYTNTIVHERVHSLGQHHVGAQTRAANICDAAYVLGDLAEAVARYRAGVPGKTEGICPALAAALAIRAIAFD